MNEVKRQQFKKKLDELAGPVDLLGDPGLEGLFNLPDLAGLVDVAEIGQALLGLAGELLANLGDLSS